MNATVAEVESDQLLQTESKSTVEIGLINTTMTALLTYEMHYPERL